MVKEFTMFLKGHYTDLILNDISYLDFVEMLNENFRWQIEFRLENNETVISLEHEKVVYYLSMEVEEDRIVFKKTGAQ